MVVLIADHVKLYISIFHQVIVDSIDARSTTWASYINIYLEFVFPSFGHDRYFVSLKFRCVCDNKLVKFCCFSFACFSCCFQNKSERDFENLNDCKSSFWK